MKYIYLLIVVFGLGLSVGCGQSASAQTVPDATTATETTSGAEITESEELAPLEEVEMPGPVLSTGEHGERQTYLSVGEPAPWAGILLNPEAMAFIISEYQALYERGTVALRRQHDSDWTRLQLEVRRLRLRLDTERATYRVELEGRDREILRLQEAHQALIEANGDNFWEDFLMVGGGVLGGIVVGIVVGFLAGL